MDTRHLEQLLPGSDQLCDLILVADQTRFPVHSAYLASHCEFIKHFSLDVGPFSWKAPQIIEAPFQDHSSATMHCLLLAVYGNDDMDSTDFPLTEPWQACDLYKLADQLHCPKVLDICIDYLSMAGSCLFFTKSAQDALRCCIVTENIPRLSQLHHACTAAIAADFQAVGNDERMLQLSREALLHIMQAMATQIVKLEITSDAETASRKPKAGPSLIITDSSSESEDESEAECNRQRQLLRKRKAGPSPIITDSSSESDSEDESECDRQRQLLRMKG
ncbi:hypothetical protein ABBQ38_013208 [Trebouxia sp. C0009 RCD-2024]